MVRKRKKYPIDRELLDRHCPICGADVKADTPLHHCDEEWLKSMEAGREHHERRMEEEGIIESPRSYHDRLSEAAPLLDPDGYYENDKDESEPEF